MPQEIRKEAILFPNNQRATAIFPAADASPTDILAALDLKPHKTLILIIGGAEGVDEKLKPRLIQLFGRGIARAAANANAVIIDGGTQSGVMAMMGQGVADRGSKCSLIGVAPKALIAYPGSPSPSSVNLDPNHSHFVLVEGGEWGSGLATIFNLAGALTRDAPGVAILASGGANARDEVVQVVRQNLPLIVIEGSGGLADEIVAAWKARPASPDDPAMAEIIADGRIEFHLLNNSVEGAERLILRELRGDNVLYQAWETFADYDLNAMLQQKRFDLLQASILTVGVAATTLAVIKQLGAPPDASVSYRSAWWWLRHLIFILPILLTILITAANRFKHGNQWMMLRAGAEAIKREIYRYRTRTTSYGGWSPDQPSPEQQLSRKVQDITQATMETDANLATLESYDKKKGFPPYLKPGAEGGDDGFKKLSPDRYIEVRLEDQLKYFNRAALKLGRRMTVLQWAVWIIGAVGTYLALVGQQVWVAVTTSIAAALTSYLGYKLSEDKLMKFNQARTELANVRAWWNALSPDDQADQENVDMLVEHTEQVLKSELDNWVQLKQNVLAEVRKAATATDTGSKK